jgi:hypothetical protein
MMMLGARWRFTTSSLGGVAPIVNLNGAEGDG